MVLPKGAAVDPSPAGSGCALLAVRFGAGLRLSQIGFKPWRQWNAIEKSYFVQVLIIANIVFPLIFAAPLRRIFAQPNSLEWW